MSKKRVFIIGPSEIIPVMSTTDLLGPVNIENIPYEDIPGILDELSDGDEVYFTRWVSLIRFSESVVTARVFNMLHSIGFEETLKGCSKEYANDFTAPIMRARLHTMNYTGTASQNMAIAEMIAQMVCGSSRHHDKILHKPNLETIGVKGSRSILPDDKYQWVKERGLHRNDTIIIYAESPMTYEYQTFSRMSFGY